MKLDFCLNSRDEYSARHGPYTATHIQLNAHVCSKKPVTTMLTYPWKCTVLHCNHLGNTWKPLVLMTRHFDKCRVINTRGFQVFPRWLQCKTVHFQGRLAWWLLAFLCLKESFPGQPCISIMDMFTTLCYYISYISCNIGHNVCCLVDLEKHILRRFTVWNRHWQSSAHQIYVYSIILYYVTIAMVQLGSKVIQTSLCATYIWYASVTQGWTSQERVAAHICIVTYVELCSILYCSPRHLTRSATSLSPSTYSANSS